MNIVGTISVLVIRARSIPLLGIGGLASAYDHRAAFAGLRARFVHRGRVLGVDERGGWRRVVEDVGDLGGLEAVADLDRGRAEPGERLLRDQILGAVRQHQRDALAAGNPARDERAREPIDRRVEPAPAETAGAAEPLLADRSSAGMRGRL